jgi:hypothetical protein
MKPPFGRFCALLAFLVAVQAAHATIAIVDQQNPVGMAGTGPVVGTGQSFTPSLPALDVVDLSLSTTADVPSTAVTLHLDLFSGMGFTGTLLGSSNPVTVSQFGFHLVEFNFPSLIPLVPGNVYSFQIIGGGYEELGSLGNLYTGGTEMDSGGNPGNGTFDLVFAEGLSVPEPSSFLLCVCGGLVTVTARRKRK